MADSDSEQTNQAVAQVYAKMTDGQLQKLADEAWSLTDAAREALKLELGRRGIELKLAASAAEGVDIDNLVLLRRFRDLPDALLAKGALESAGIQSFLGDDITIRMDWLWSDALGGVKLRVKREDADTATQVLDQGVPDGFDESQENPPHESK